MTTPVLCSVDGGLCRLTLANPDRLNVLSLATFQALDHHLSAVDWEQVGCVLLAGEGRSFCAGHDLAALASGEETSRETEWYENRVIARLAELPCPVVGRIQGHCYTGGLELALACDLLVCADDARFADTHARFDLVPVWGLSQRLPRRVGAAKAKEMMFTGRSYSGREALAMGLVDQCVPAAELDAAVDALVRDILSASRRSLRFLKALLRESEGLPLGAGLALELHRSPGHGPEFTARLAEFRARRR